jgi:hypothetical protein
VATTVEQLPSNLAALDLDYATSVQRYSAFSPWSMRSSMSTYTSGKATMKDRAASVMAARPTEGGPSLMVSETARRVILGHARRILAAPRLGVPPGELTQLIWAGVIGLPPWFATFVVPAYFSRVAPSCRNVRIVSFGMTP